MGLLLQVAENFNEEPNYTLFFEFNRVYLWGPEDPSDPVVYINVQNDV